MSYDLKLNHRERREMLDYKLIMTKHLKNMR